MDFQMKMFYFGAYEKAGHYLFDSSLYSVNDSKLKEIGFPIKPNTLDGGFLNNIQDIPGYGKLFYISGWTILTFWDRSQDKRTNSNSAFIVEAILSFPDMIEKCKEQFPKLFDRFNFDIFWKEVSFKAIKNNNWQTTKDIKY